ncbi:hypothetical protein Hanom_Chr13g01187491 [Helianthus anomalus]
MRCGIISYRRRASPFVAHRPLPLSRRWRPSADVWDEPCDWLMVAPQSPTPLGSPLSMVHRM